MILKGNQKHAFTLVELMMALGVLTVIFGLSISFYRSSIGGFSLLTGINELQQHLKRAQQLSASGFHNSSWGVYFDTTASPARYVIFKGNSYTARDQNFDAIYELPSEISFDAVSITGGGSEVVFTKPQGETTHTGTITLENREGNIKQLEIRPLGIIAEIPQVSGQPQTVNAPLAADSYMYKFQPATNNGSDTKIWVQSWYTSYHERGTIRFNLSSIPQTATVQSATLKLFLYNTQGTQRNYGAHKINSNRDWVESEVTWNSYRSSLNWTDPGGDFQATATDTKPAGSWSGTGYWVEWNVTADAQTFVSTPTNNFGWIIKDAAESATAQYYVWFYSKEHSDATKRPMLEITYR